MTVHVKSISGGVRASDVEIRPRHCLFVSRHPIMLKYRARNIRLVGQNCAHARYIYFRNNHLTISYTTRHANEDTDTTQLLCFQSLETRYHIKQVET